ncbi:MAG: DUF4159 domain-containing protein [Alphaproteobacteria bacterium]
MLTFGALTFTAPAVLLGLAVLPVLWWLLRVSPPAPRRVRFPALRLLLGVTTQEETPARMPWWLLALRLLAAALLLTALAGPLWQARAPETTAAGPVVIAVDTGWAAAPGWTKRETVLDDLLSDATRRRADVVIVPTTGPHAAGLTPVRPEAARQAAERLTPRPFGPDREGLIAPLEALGRRLAERGQTPRVYWLSDGYDYGRARDFASALSAVGSLTVLLEPAGQRPLALQAPEVSGTTMAIKVVRGAGTAGEARAGEVTLRARDGRTLAAAPYAIAAEDVEGVAEITLPVDIRNRAGRFDLIDAATGPSAAGVWLLDGRWRRRPVGLVSGSSGDGTRPLLSDLFYLRRALAPYTDLREGRIERLLDGGLSVLILSDVGRIVGPARRRVDEWVDEGGVLIRFAGPRVAAGGDDLIPVPLRRGGRALGGALSWDTPQTLAPFDDDGPFAGLEIRDEILVERQVLAEPTPDLDSRTWARLSDGTPLVTADRRGQGWIVLVHVTANQDWSSLPLSGLYVDMLRRLIDLAAGMPGSQDGVSASAPRAPVRVLDGFGALVAPPGDVFPLDPRRIGEAPDARNPPGLYGQEGAELAFNLAPAPLSFRALPPLGADIRRTGYVSSPALDLRPPLFLVVVLLIVLEGAATLRMTGEVGKLRRLTGGAAALVLACTLTALPAPARAETAEDARAVALARTSHLAYVITGDGASDSLARAGLEALSQVLTARTAYEPGRPVGVRLGQDPLVFHPLVFWRLTAAQPPLDADALAALDDFMKNGGTVIIDTADHGDAVPGADAAGMTTARARMREILNTLDLPPLAPVPDQHVLRKAFYLLKEFPGRYAGGGVWVAAGSGGDAARPLDGAPLRHDGVSPIIIGANDWAGAWARDRSGLPMTAVVPGGERQREMAYRFGINLVMYTLSGNYKADQVHVPAILERLSQ